MKQVVCVCGAFSAFLFNRYFKWDFEVCHGWSPTRFGQWRQPSPTKKWCFKINYCFSKAPCEQGEHSRASVWEVVWILWWRVLSTNDCQIHQFGCWLDVNGLLLLVSFCCVSWGVMALLSWIACACAGHQGRLSRSRKSQQHRQRQRLRSASDLQQNRAMAWTKGCKGHKPAQTVWWFPMKMRCYCLRGSLTCETNMRNPVQIQADSSSEATWGVLSKWKPLVISFLHLLYNLCELHVSVYIIAITSLIYYTI